ncbi:MAG: hypothetical protein HXX08_16880 [Chloroflexi bacterium]|uniref:6-bladed beta-propeller n=1 Tax=Candidatus Chlorohelix allophototropha TaxID=3003348 RepID=A0A8T7M607_9CHLR|nr:hypothetical protein [Chloroflexota bacterium]WJW69446.1 hypothetical protein OZ401_003058 [Chloroflexota bacterium L227-S17]
MNRIKFAGVFFSVLLMLGLFVSALTPALADDSEYFEATGKTVSGKFLQYWHSNGGLSVFGYPITEAQMEVNPEDGQVYLTQWFERHRFELHPEKAGTPFEILTGLLGKDLRREALEVDPDFKRADVLYNVLQPKEQQWYFEQTGHNLRFRFLEYWMANGGLERFGYPISEEHREVDPETGKSYVMQWFERARFEYHPENQRPYDVLLGLLGKQIKNPVQNKLEFMWKIGASANNFRRPDALAIDKSDNVYVVDITGKRVFKYGSNGQFQARWSVDGPSALAIDSRDNLFVARRSAAQIAKYDSNGSLLYQKYLYAINNSNYRSNIQLGVIAIDPYDNLFVADPDTAQVHKFDGEGNFLLTIGGEGAGDGQFGFSKYGYNFINGLGCDAQGNLYVLDPVNSRIQIFDNNGNFLRKITKVSGIDLGRADSLAVDEQGQLYLTTYIVLNSTNFNYSLLKLDSNGTVLLTVQLNNQNNNSSVITVRNGNLYIGSYKTKLVSKYSTDGQLLLSWGNSTDPNTRFDFINHLWLDRQDNLYIIDNQTMRKFDNKGHFLQAWNPPSQTWAVYFDGNDKFYYSEELRDTDTQPYERVTVLNTTGGQISQFSIKNQPCKSYSYGGQRFSGVDRQGDLYFLYSYDPGSSYPGQQKDCIQKFDSTGKLLAEWGSYGSGDGQFKFKIINPDGTGSGYIPQIALDEQGNCYVTDLGNYRIQKFDSTGKFLAQWSLFIPPDYKREDMTPNNLIVDNKSQVYVEVAGYLQKYDSNGNLIINIKTTDDYSIESADGSFFSRSIAIDTAGHLFVGDYSERVQKLVLR